MRKFHWWIIPVLAVIVVIVIASIGVNIHQRKTVPSWFYHGTLLPEESESIWSYPTRYVIEYERTLSIAGMGRYKYYNIYLWNVAGIKEEGIKFLVVDEETGEEFPLAEIPESESESESINKYGGWYLSGYRIFNWDSISKEYGNKYQRIDLVLKEDLLNPIKLIVKNKRGSVYEKLIIFYRDS